MLYLSAIFLSFFLALLLFTKKGITQADKILGTWLTVIGIHMVSSYVFFTQQYGTYPTLTVIGLSLPLLHGPFFYLYTLRQTTPYPFRKKHFFHFLPFVISLLIFAKFHFLSEAQKIQVFDNKGEDFRIETRINHLAIYFSGIVYIFLSIQRLLRHRRNIVHHYSNTERINFNWLLYLVIWMVGIWVVVIFVGGDKPIFAAVSCFVLWLGYFGIKQVPVFTQSEAVNSTTFRSEAFSSGPPPQKLVLEKTGSHQEGSVSENIKYAKSTLTENDVSEIHVRLIDLLNKLKPYTNPDLTLNNLAQQLDVHPNHISQVINSREKKSFYDLINEKRVEEFIRLSTQPGNKQYTLLGLAFDCGFNSKASFNRNFKKCKGVSPSDYLKFQAIH